MKNTHNIQDADLESQAKSRRQYPRRAVRWRARIITAQKKLLEGETVNISQKGAMITLPVKLELQSEVLVEIQSFLKGKVRSIKARGIVKHTSLSMDGIHIGIFFKETTEEAERFLEKFTSGQI